MPIEDKMDCESKTVTRDQESHYIMTRESAHQWNVTIVSICILSVPKYIKGCYKKKTLIGEGIQ